MKKESQFQLVQSGHNHSLNQLKESIDQHESLLGEMGVSINSGSLAFHDLAAYKVEIAEKISVDKHWWGIDIVMNEKLTQDIITGITGSGALAGAIASAFGGAGVITGGVAAIIGAGIAGVVALKVMEIKLVDNGNGVHWPITWLQWAALIAAVPTGPAGVIAAGMVFLHPLRN